MPKLLQIRQRVPAYQLTWIINNICTNHCDYCVPTLHEGKNHHYDWSRAREFAQRIIDTVAVPINLAIGGGEPTVSPHFEEMVSMFWDRGHTSTVTTNGVRSPQWWDRVAPKTSGVAFSYHHAWRTESFLDSARACAQHARTTVRVMMDSRYFEECVEMYQTVLADPKLGVEAVRILPETSMRTVGAEYTDRQNQLLERYSESIYKPYPLPKHRPATTGASYAWSDGTWQDRGSANHVVSTSQNRFAGWACNIGADSLFIGWDGWVKKGNCMQGGNLFHINDHVDHELPLVGEICEQEICSCLTDVNISKVPLNIDTSGLDIKKRPVLSANEYQIKFQSK
jgi:organic radical activating enzyme